jgi:hypothetical protein
VAKDKTPNLTLRIATGLDCDYGDCGNHGVKSVTMPDGTIKRRCLWHQLAQKVDNDDYMLKFLGLI